MSRSQARVIASQGAQPYSALMVRRLLRLLTMIAVLLMPFGMAAAPAAPASGHHAGMAMPAGHCSEEAPTDNFGGGPADCAMPCSAAVPAADLSAVKSRSINVAAAEPALERALAGILLEIATPPPKLA